MVDAEQQGVSQAKDQSGQQARARYLSGCSLDWRSAWRRVVRLNRAWLIAFLRPFGLTGADRSETVS